LLEHAVVVVINIICILALYLGPFHGAIAVSSVTHCRRCCCCRGHHMPPAL